MTNRRRFASSVAALALLAAPAAALAHGNGDDHGKGDPHAAIGTVTSFTGGVLTITLNDGNAIAGKVSPRTLIKCRPAPAAAATTARASKKGGRDDDPSNNRGKDGNGNANGHDDDHGKGDDGHPKPPAKAHTRRCAADNLTAGTKVDEAKISLKSTGATWKKVELLK